LCLYTIAVCKSGVLASDLTHTLSEKSVLGELHLQWAGRHTKGSNIGYLMNTKAEQLVWKARVMKDRAGSYESDA